MHPQISQHISFHLVLRASHFIVSVSWSLEPVVRRAAEQRIEYAVLTGDCECEAKDWLYLLLVTIGYRLPVETGEQAEIRVSGRSQCVDSCDGVCASDLL